MSKFRIAVWAQDDIAEDVLLALSAWDTELADTAAPIQSEIKAFEEQGFSHFVIMDSTMSDKELLTSLKQVQTDLTVVFISDGKRPCPSKFYNALLLCGVAQITANTKDKEYMELDELVEIITHPISTKDAKRFCVDLKVKNDPKVSPVNSISNELQETNDSSKNIIQEKTEERSTEDLVQEKADSKVADFGVTPLARPPQVAELDTSVARKIVFAQSLPHSGSTHLLYACARALAIMGKRVAAVIQQSDWEGLHRVFSRVPCNQELGLLNINGVDIYYGDEPTQVPRGYDYILCDIAQTLWLQIDPKLLKAKKLDVTSRTALKKLDVYMSADLCIHSSFLASTCEWREARLTIPKMAKREIAKTTFAVFGVPFRRVEDELKKRIDQLSSGRAQIVFIPIISAPLFMSSDDGIPESILKLLEPVITKYDSEKWSTAQSDSSKYIDNQSDGFKIRFPWRGRTNED